jgi:hypothetical protein
MRLLNSKLELKRLREWYVVGAGRTLIISGVSGIGKSAFSAYSDQAIKEPSERIIWIARQQRERPIRETGCEQFDKSYTFVLHKMSSAAARADKSPALVILSVRRVPEAPGDHNNVGALTAKRKGAR